MNILGYVGVGTPGREPSAREAVIRRAKSGRGALDLFLDYAPEEGRVPINYFPLHGLGHDCAAAILTNGRLVAAVAEERFNRCKHSISLEGRNILPKRAAQYCLEAVGKNWNDVDYVCHYLDMTPAVMARRHAVLTELLPEAMREPVIAANWRSYEEEFSHDRIFEQLQSMAGADFPRQKLQFTPHHLAHAAASYYSSGFDAAGVVTLDGYGEKDSGVFAVGDRNRLDIRETVEIPNSLGILYMVVTVFLGFRALNDEYKVMGLAACGTPEPYRKAMAEMFRWDEAGRYRTPILADPNLIGRLVNLFGPPREPGAPITRRDMDIAAALQERLEETVLVYLVGLKDRHGFENLCMSGGVALNSVLNGRIACEKLFKCIYVFPAAGDDGCAVGAAQYFYHNVLGNEGRSNVGTMYLGPGYSQEEVLAALYKHADRIEWARSENVADAAAEMILGQKVVGWFQGRGEFGPRALGNRSILGDARNPDMKDIINQKVKWREPFRPFAPAVKHNRAVDFFDMGQLEHSPFMLFVVPVHDDAKSRVPAVTHHDGSARVQTVKREENERLWCLLDHLERRTGVGLCLNTSFNVKGEPIVGSPEDAILCFLKTNIDAVVVDDYVVTKKRMNNGSA